MHRNAATMLPPAGALAASPSAAAVDSRRAQKRVPSSFCIRRSSACGAPVSKIRRQQWR